jgi:hypothetical protein
MDPLTITGLAVGTALGALVIGGIGTAVIHDKISRKTRTRVPNNSNSTISTRRLSTSISRGKNYSRRLSSIAEGKGRSRKSKK